MSNLKLSVHLSLPGLGSWGVVGWLGRAAQIGSGRALGAAWFAGQRVRVEDADRDTCDLRYVSPMLCQALQDEPNLEVEWLWYAKRMRRADERRYCLQCALEIDPRSQAARQALAAI